MKTINHRVRFVLLLLGLLAGGACAAEPADEPDTDVAAADEDDQAPPDLTRDAPPEGAIVLTLVEAQVEKGASCGGFSPCGIVYNRSGRTLQLARDAKSHFYCKSPSKLRDLPSGANSNSHGSPHWPDVDCVRSRGAWMYTNGRYYPPGEWVRVWTSKWVY